MAVIQDVSYLNAAHAARFLGVSKSYFEDHIRPFVSYVDMRAPGSKKPMPRYARVDLEAFAEKRRVTRKSA